MGNFLNKPFVLFFFFILLVTSSAQARVSKKELTTHDPKIFRLIYNRQFDKIPMKSWYNRQIGVIMASLIHLGCHPRNPVYKQKAIKLTAVIINMATAGSTRNRKQIDALGGLALPAYLPQHTAFYATINLIKNLGGCKDPRIQRMLTNTIDLIIYRDPARVRARFKKMQAALDATNLPLASQKIERMHVSIPVRYYKDKRKEKIFQDMLSRILYDDKNFLLGCLYQDKSYKKPKGPGRVVYKNLKSSKLTFWYKQVPFTKKELRILPDTHWWRNMGVIALDTCPKNRIEALKIQRNNWKTWKKKKQGL